MSGLETGIFKGLDTTGGGAAAGVGGFGWLGRLSVVLPLAMAANAAMD